MIVARLAEGKAIAKLNSDFKEVSETWPGRREQLDHAMELLEKVIYKVGIGNRHQQKPTLTRERKETQSNRIIRVVNTLLFSHQTIKEHFI